MKTSILSAINHAIIANHRCTQDIAAKVGVRPADYTNGTLFTIRELIMLPGHDFRAAAYGRVDQAKIDAEIAAAYARMVANFRMRIEFSSPERKVSIHPVFFNVVQIPSYNPLSDMYAFSLVLDYTEISGL